MQIKKKPLVQHLKIITSFCCILIICLSCQKREAYYQFHEIDNTHWSKLDTAYFSIDSASIELNVPYDITFELVTNANYPYQNIWLYVQDNIENKAVFDSYSMQYMLADDFGRWHGAGFGLLYQLSLNYKKQVVFKEKRNYLIKLQHGMRDEPLAGVEKIGLLVQKAE